MSLLEWLAIAVTILTVYALIKRLETRLVLFTAGFVLCLVSMDPLSALNSFAKSMTNNSLVMAICSSMGLLLGDGNLFVNGFCIHCKLHPM